MSAEAVFLLEVQREGADGLGDHLAAREHLPRRRFRLAALFLLRRSERFLAVQPDGDGNPTARAQFLHAGVQRWVQLAEAARAILLDPLEHGVRIDLAARLVVCEACGGAGRAIGGFQYLDVAAARAAGGGEAFGAEVVHAQARHAFDADCARNLGLGVGDKEGNLHAIPEAAAVPLGHEPVNNKCVVARGKAFLRAPGGHAPAAGEAHAAADAPNNESALRGVRVERVARLDHDRGGGEDDFVRCHVRGQG